jgi:hypothetical protein
LRIATAVELGQNRVSLISRGIQEVAELTVITRIADGLGMPDHARIQVLQGETDAIRLPDRRRSMTS